MRIFFYLAIFTAINSWHKTENKSLIKRKKSQIAVCVVCFLVYRRWYGNDLMFHDIRFNNANNSAKPK